MVAVDLTLGGRKSGTFGLLMVYAINDNGYAALTPLKEDGEPAPAEAVVLACEGSDDEGYDFYEIDDAAEYNKAASAFSMLLERI